MASVTLAELPEILRLHRAWLYGEAGGSRADLSRADLSGAVLSGAVLSGAVLSDGTILDSGESWLVYRTETLPQLLLAGERGLEALAHWDNHEWTDCPMAVAFSISNVAQAPALLRPRVTQFVALFDARLIPQPTEADLLRWRKDGPR